jgi:hypothetical protein
MKKTRATLIVLLALTACVCWLPKPAATLVQIKVENDGGIIAGMNKPSSAQFGYDHYFIPVNSLSTISLPATKKADGAH